MSRRIANRSRVRSPKSGVRSRFPFPLFAFSPFRLLPCGERAAALTTELKPSRIVKATLRAAVAELRPALTAEFHPSGILKIAMWTLHGQCIFPARASTSSARTVPDPVTLSPSTSLRTGLSKGDHPQAPVNPPPLRVPPAVAAAPRSFPSLRSSCADQSPPRSAPAQQ